MLQGKPVLASTYEGFTVKENGQFDLSIIIVSWNVSDLLADCLDSILYSPVTLNPANDDDQRISIEIIVVDSDSTDGTVPMLRRYFPEITLLPQTENVGFTRGNNIGLEAATGRYLFLLNPDTLVLGPALVNMVKYLDEHPDVGIIGPYTLNTNGTMQSTRRRFPTVAIGFYESTWLQPFAPKNLLRRYYVDDAPMIATLDVDWVQGSALMARREVYTQIGGLDTNYFMFSEELDWCKRAKDAGWRVVFYCNAQIIHHGGQSTQQVSAHKHIYFQESKLRYFRKYHGARVAFALRLFLLFNYTTQILIEGFKGLLGSKRAMRRQRIREYWQVIRSGLRVT
ncbi:MAG: glycosyltransferase family 2 protein [Anaerolineae bacterium]